MPSRNLRQNRLLRQVEVIGNCQCFIQSLSWNCLRTQLFRRNYNSGPCPKTCAPTPCLKPRTRSYASRLHALLQSKLYKQVLTRTFDQCQKNNKICTISAVNCLTQRRHRTVLRVLIFRGDLRALLCERVLLHFAFRSQHDCQQMPAKCDYSAKSLDEEFKSKLFLQSTLTDKYSTMPTALPIEPDTLRW